MADCKQCIRRQFYQNKQDTLSQKVLESFSLYETLIGRQQTRSIGYHLKTLKTYVYLASHRLSFQGINYQ